MRITEKLLVVFLPIFLLSVVAVTLLSRRVVQQELIEERANRGRAAARELSRSDLVFAVNAADLTPLKTLAGAARRRTDAAYIEILSTTGQRLAESVDRRQVASVPRQPEGLRAVDGWQRQVRVDSLDLLDLTVPIRPQETAAPVAVLRLGFSVQEARDTGYRISRDVLWIAMIVNLLVLSCTLLYVRTVLRPVRQMSRATELIAGGQLGETVPVLSRDEMGDLAHSFNHMSRELALTTVSAEFLDRVVDSMRDVLVVMNPDGSIRRINHATETALGVEEGDLLGRAAHHLFDGVDSLFTSEGLFDLDLKEGVDGIEAQLCRRDGARIPVLLSVAPFHDREGRLAGYIATAADISERIRAEQATRRSLQQKEVLLKEIHHRVKNNLQVISSLLNLQSDHHLDEDTRRLFSDSQSRIKAMALIHEKLYQSEDLSRVDFHDYLSSLVMSLYQTHRRDELRLDLQLDAQHIQLGIDQAIPCGLIINELVSNSMKHAFDGRSQGRLGIEFREEADGCYRLDVTDDGIGLPPDFDLTTADSLGLRLVEILSQQLKGEISREPSPEGTHFRMTFSEAMEDVPAPAG